MQSLFETRPCAEFWGQADTGSVSVLHSMLSPGMITVKVIK